MNEQDAWLQSNFSSLITDFLTALSSNFSRNFFSSINLHLLTENSISTTIILTTRDKFTRLLHIFEIIKLSFLNIGVLNFMD